jgi:hypothetical protein
MFVHSLLGAIGIYSIYHIHPYTWMYVLLAFSVYTCKVVWIPLSIALGPFCGIAVWTYFFTTPFFDMVTEWKWGVYGLLVFYGMISRYRYISQLKESL